MSEDIKEKLIKSIKKELSCCDEYLTKAKKIAETVPLVYERKQESEVKLSALNQLSDKFFSANGDKLLSIQLGDEKRLEEALPPLPENDKYTIWCSSSSATSSAIYTAVCQVGTDDSWIIAPEFSLDSIQEVQRQFESIASNKANNDQLPIILRELKPSLEEEFKTASTSIQKCMADLFKVSQAASLMRNVIEQTWGGLVNQARQKCLLNQRHLKLKTQDHRKIIAVCLSKTPDSQSLENILEDLFKLHSELSDLFKDTLADDKEKLKVLNTKWLFLIDSACKMIEL